MSRFYAPDGTPCTVEEWGRYSEELAHKVVKQETICVGTVWVSTVYLGVDYQWLDGPPLIYETMVFTDGPMSDECQRYYTTREQAVEGHREMVRLCELDYAARRPA